MPTYKLKKGQWIDKRKSGYIIKTASGYKTKSFRKLSAARRKIKPGQTKSF